MSDVTPEVADLAMERDMAEVAYYDLRKRVLGIAGELDPGSDLAMKLRAAASGDDPKCSTPHRDDMREMSS